jgi:hypothetical protein
MSGPDTAADLTGLAGWIDEQLGDKTADRQWIAESAAAKIRDITLQMLGAAELAARRITAPLETEDQARELAAVRAVYAAFDADPGPGRMAPHNERMLIAACYAAGVELGAYDRRLLAWLAGWEPQTCAVVAGLITRAAAGRGRCGMTGATHRGTCDYDERPTVARIRWTVYGGAYKYAYVCEYHLSCVNGQQGVDIWPVVPQDEVTR